MSVSPARILPRRFGVASISWSRAPAGLRWRRVLTLALGALWLLDAALQYQPYMFSDAFPRDVIAPSGDGSPVWVAEPVRWSANLLASNLLLFNGLFATVQLAIAIGLVMRSTVRVALAASLGWSLLVWWLGEGLGGVLAGPVSPLAGFPGAVVLYALITVLLWPPRPRPSRNPRRRSVATAGLLGFRGAQTAWLILWAALAYEAIQPVNRGPGGLAGVIRDAASGEPNWLAGFNRSAASALAHDGTPYSIALAVLCALIAVGIFVPAITRPVIAVAFVLGLGIWVVGQDLGAIATGSGTDPNSGLPLALLALCYWPLRDMYAPPSGAARAA